MRLRDLVKVGSDRPARDRAKKARLSPLALQVLVMFLCGNVRVKHVAKFFGPYACRP